MSRPPGTMYFQGSAGSKLSPASQDCLAMTCIGHHCRCIYGALRMLRLQTFAFCFASSDFIPMVWTKMHSNKHQSNSWVSLGFLWGTGWVYGTRIAMEGRASVQSEVG